MAQSGAAPGGIRLLPGYFHERGRGVDSEVGTISRKGGLKVEYDIGPAAGDYTNCKWCGWTQDEVWRKEQIISGQKIIVVFTKTKRLVVSFPEKHANFHAIIGSEAEMADMLLMVMTYSPR